jgi:hypothetical protein
VLSARAAAGHRFDFTPSSSQSSRRSAASSCTPPEDGPWASGYYSILFEDPDGIRLEINFVPGKGNLAEGVTLPLMARPGGAPDQE